MANNAFEQVKARVAQGQRRWLVTGSAGFIGSHLIEHLLKLYRTGLGMA